MSFPAYIDHPTQLARRHLIFTAKFLPTVAEVREAIKEQARQIIYLGWKVDELPKHLDYLKTQQRRAEEEKRKEEERERQMAEIIEKRRLERVLLRGPCDNDDKIPF